MLTLSYNYYSYIPFTKQFIYESTNYANFKKIFFCYYRFFIVNNDHLLCDFSLKTFKANNKQYTLIKGPKGHKVGKVILKRTLFKIYITLGFKISENVKNINCTSIVQMDSIMKSFIVSTPKLYLAAGTFSLNFSIFN